MSIMERREAVYKSCSVRIEWFKVIAYTLKCFPDGIDKKLRVLETEKGDSLLCYDVAIKEFDYGFGSWYIDYTWILATKDIICVEYYLIDYIRLLKAIEGHISEHRDCIISKYKGFGYKDAEGVLKEKEELLTREKDRCEKVVCLLKGSSLNTEGDTERADEEEQNSRRTAVEKRNDKADKKAGRPVKPFDDVVAEQGNKEAIKSRLHALIDGKKDKGAVLYMKAAILLGLVQRPTYQQFKKEFGNIVSKQQYGKCLREEIYTQDEIEGAKSAIGKT